MKFAIVNDNPKAEATPDAKGLCPHCESEMLARCGEKNVWHWAHKGKLHCDRWWEPETEWHRAWKGQFPAEYQEVRHLAEDGEWHIADVKTEQEWVLEFQYSPIKPDERRTRNAFYPKLVWVVNGSRRMRDKPAFSNLLKDGVRVSERVWRLSPFLDECGLTRDWVNDRVPVFFDFGENDPLWCLVPHGGQKDVYVVAFSRAEFIGCQRAEPTQVDQGFSNLLEKIKGLVSADISRRLVEARNEMNRQLQVTALRRRESFQRRLAWARPRRRF